MKKIAIVSLILATPLLFAQQISYVEYVNVRSSKPTYENVITRVPHQECYDEQVPVTYNQRVPNRNSGLNAGALLGGASGGFIGKQISHGDPVATIGGAIIGTLVGQNAARVDDRVYQSTRYERRRNCTTRYSERSERRFMGYKNVARYKGREIVKYSDQKLSTFPVTVTVSY